MLARLLIAIFTLAVIVLAVLTVRNWAEQLAEAAAVPVSINDSDLIVDADNPDVCPGDILMWPLTITYERGGLLMDVTRNVRNLDTGRLFVADGTIYTEQIRVPQEEAGTFGRQSLWRVPQLPPARYRLITSTQSVTGGNLLQYYVEFTVRSDCL